MQKPLSISAFHPRSRIRFVYILWYPEEGFALETERASKVASMGSVVSLLPPRINLYSSQVDIQIFANLVMQALIIPATLGAFPLVSPIPLLPLQSEPIK